MHGILQDSDGKCIKKLVHNEYGHWYLFAFLLILIILLHQIFQFRKPLQIDGFKLILRDEFLSEGGGILIIKSKEGFILLKLLHDIRLLLFSVIL